MNNKIKIGVYTATAIVAANIIGTGVFTSLGFQVMGLKSGFTILALWFLGGIAALCGAFAYGELGAAMPRSGGEYHLLSRIYHPFVGFLSGWISIVVGFSAPIAAAAMAMGNYSSKVFINIGWILPESENFFKLIVGISAVTLVSAVHLLNVKKVSSFQMFFTSLKIALIIVLIFFGFLLAIPQNISFLPDSLSISAMFSAPFAISLVFVMYAYSGWNASAYIVGDIEKPERNLPRSLFLGTFIVLLLYVPINAVFLYSTPISEIEGKVEVGYLAATHIFGNTGGIIMGLLISIGLISAISSMVWAGPRVTQVMGEDLKLLKFLSYKNKNDVPSKAIFFQYIIILILIFTSTFDSVVYYIGFTLSLSSFLTVFGVFVLRYKFPELPRPYKTTGYPVTPLIYLGVTGWMLFFVVKDRPVESLASLATVLLGGIVYFIDKQISKK